MQLKCKQLVDHLQLKYIPSFSVFYSIFFFSHFFAWRTMRVYFNVFQFMLTCGFNWTTATFYSIGKVFISRLRCYLRTSHEQCTPFVNIEISYHFQTTCEHSSYTNCSKITHKWKLKLQHLQKKNWISPQVTEWVIYIKPHN